MSFTTEFVRATEQDCSTCWAGRGPGEAFFCAFCGHDFQVGDEYRMVYTNDMSWYGGNPLVCRKCFDFDEGVDGLRLRWRRKCNEFRTRFKYWAVRY